jgi:hypothetical protein
LTEFLAESVAKILGERKVGVKKLGLPIEVLTADSPYVIAYVGQEVELADLIKCLAAARYAVILIPNHPTESEVELARSNHMDVRHAPGWVKWTKQQLAHNENASLYLFLTRGQIGRTAFIDESLPPDRIFIAAPQGFQRSYFEVALQAGLEKGVPDRLAELEENGEFFSRIREEGSGGLPCAIEIDRNTPFAYWTIRQRVRTAHTLAGLVNDEPVLLVSNSAQSVLPLIEFLGRASRLLVLLWRQPTDDEVAFSLSSSARISFLHFATDVAAPYTVMDIQAVEAAGKSAATVLRALWGDYSDSLSPAFDSVLPHLEIALEDEIYSAIKPALAAEKLFAERPTRLFLDVDALRLQTFLAFSDVRSLPQGVRTFLCTRDADVGYSVFRQWTVGQFASYDWIERASHNVYDVEVADFIEPPGVAEGELLIVAAGDRNYTDTVHAIACEASANRAVRVWSIAKTYDGVDPVAPQNTSISMISGPQPWKPVSAEDRISYFASYVQKVLPNDYMSEVAYECAVGACARHIVHRLPVLAGRFAAFIKAFAAGRPESLVVCNGRAPIARMVVEAARAFGVQSIDVQAVLLSDYKRVKKPVTDFVAVMETMSAHLMTDHFGIPENRVLVVGSARIDRSRSRTVMLATQPLDTSLSVAAAEHVISTVKNIPGARLIIKLHPRESALIRKRYENLVTRLMAEECCEIVLEVPIAQVIARADIVVTFFSNVGLEAAVLGKDVLTLALDGEYPMNFHRHGLAMAASTPEEIDGQLTRYLTDNAFRADITAQRHAFLAGNSQLYSGNTGKRLCSYIESFPVADTHEGSEDGKIGRAAQGGWEGVLKMGNMKSS